MKRGQHAWTWMAVGACLSGAWPSSVSAAPAKVAVAVVGLDGLSEQEAGKLEHAAEQAVAESGRFELVRLVDLLDPKAARVRASKAEDAARAQKAGQKAYDELDTRRAAQLFSEAVRNYKGTDATRHFDDLTRAWVMRIASLVANGETRAAQHEIDKLLPLNPRAQFSPNYFPPDTLKQVEDARRAALAGGRAELFVRTFPAGARVYLNGQYQGVSPMDLSGLPAGEHLLTVLAPGFALAQQSAIPGVNEITLRPAERLDAWESLRGTLAANSTGPGRDEAVAEFGQQLGVEQVLLLLARKSATGERLEVTGLRLDASDGHNYAYRTGMLPSGEPLHAEATALVAELTRTDEERGGGPVHHYGGGPLLTRSTLGYVLLGTGVALVAGGVYFGLQAQSQNAQYRTVAQTPEAAARLRQTGQTYGLMADLFVVGGLVSAATGGYLAFLSGPAPAPAP